ncbi:Phosphate transport system regulatory protein PhoU [Olavius algarvensis associated proteobacterium Delta 3]|nr:Phosphate transport system regulatory protein PhoU [Olavius algarvensis associated proteobacterium Delta 3]CAB5168489.1 Phosphate transport system regulatory protein PhoU [Olavius algarvensis associated proteobacterium Delta 3]
MAVHLQRELDKLKKRILSLGALVEERVHMATRAIETRDIDLATQVIKSDHEIDEMEVEVEEECLKVLALHQPVAIDLRFIAAVIKINNELERIGDQAVNIAQRIINIGQRDPIDFYFDYSIMAEKAEAMLRKSLDSLVTLDLDIAFNVLTLDDEVDEIKDDAYDKIKAAISQRPERVGYLINLFLISRHLERLADHSTNIAEEVIYLIEGEIIRHGNY